MSKKIKVAWGIDPSNSSDEIDNSCRKFFESLSSKCEVEIYPVHVSSTAHFINSLYSDVKSARDLAPYYIAEAENYLEAFQDLNIKAFKILENDSGFRSHEVSIFANYVQDLNCDYVLLASNGRTGLKRWTLGSFTENYILQSSTPTFLVHSKMDYKSDISYALAPVEIDSSAKAFLEDILGSKSLPFLRKISLLHSVRSSSFDEEAWVPELYAPSHYDFRYFIEKAREKSEKFLSALVENISSKMILHYAVSKERGELEDTIVKEAHHWGAGMIILKSNSTAANALFFGSLSRKLIHASDMPILIYPLKYKPGQMGV